MIYKSFVFAYFTTFSDSPIYFQTLSLVKTSAAFGFTINGVRSLHGFNVEVIVTNLNSVFICYICNGDRPLVK